jgi:ribosomal protein S27E
MGIKNQAIEDDLFTYETLGRVPTPEQRRNIVGVEIRNQAIMTNKRVNDDPAEDDWYTYIVDVECSNCSLKTTLVFAYWSAVTCTGCRQPMERTPYRAS